MRSGLLRAAIAGATALGALALVTAPAPAATGGVLAALECVAPTDAAGIDRQLGRAGSPLAGEGGAFVAEGVAAGIDPRALVAIAAHETILLTYGPSQIIRNPFGLGPGWAFDSEAAAIARAAATLAAYYLPEGRDTLPEIGAKWAPLGAANDPTGLNANWTAGVGAYYAAMGGDPARAIALAAQDPAPGCAGTSAPSLVAAPEGPPVVTAWGGATPRIAGARPVDGADPGTGAPATAAGFVFPLALPEGAPVPYRDTFSEPGPVECGGARLRCAITLAAAPGAHAVAMAAGTLRGASAAEAETGIAFWIETPAGDRLGYGPLASYVPGIGEGSAVAPGTPLGVVAGWVAVAWERGGARINPYPLLAATRPPA